jgi:DNA-directed RNA polymerase alpha subunit
MQENKYYKQFVDRLDVNVNIIDKLKENKITTLGSLSNYKKSDLRNFGIDGSDVNKIETELELLGLCLKDSL